jgi:hypothetical protein
MDPFEPPFVTKHTFRIDMGGGLCGTIVLTDCEMRGEFSHNWCDPAAAVATRVWKPTVVWTRTPKGRELQIANCWLIAVAKDSMRIVGV